MSKVVKLGNVSSPAVTVGDTLLEEMDSFIYLGSVIDDKGGTEADVPCGIGDFLTIFNYKYGRCFIFNDMLQKHNDISSQRYTTQPGPDNGLILELDVEQSEYLDTTESVGFKIVVNPQDTIAFPEDQGLIVMPGTSTNIGLKKVGFRFQSSSKLLQTLKTLVQHDLKVIKDIIVDLRESSLLYFQVEMSRAPPPYSACVELTDELNVELNVYSFTEGTRYTAEACRKTCYMRELGYQCGCCDLHFICPPEFYNISFCNATNTDEFVCKKQVLKMFEKGELDCLSRCLPPCEEVAYDVAHSTALWPSNNAILNEIVNNGWDKADYNSIKSSTRENVLRVVIYFEDLAVRRVESRPSYDWNRLLSDIGGQLGLWLGFSILTAMEWLELAYDAGIRVATRKSQGAHKTRVHVQESGNNY
ncbi:degenerin mec-10-like [Aplysia californica]|uniref:Degenerin mec-10-like n=1 Tax=Aplysia californica TaxID=6500 RepID=A0ABM1A7S8_APLCA|nr:degenerin mec-10-like [Aplysia californica]